MALKATQTVTALGWVGVSGLPDVRIHNLSYNDDRCQLTRRGLFSSQLMLN